MLQLQNITKYFSNKIVLDSISFRIDKPGIYGLLGPNGAGKSTLIRLLCGIIEPNNGLITYNIPMLNARKSEIGYMPEALGLYNDMTVREEVIYFAKLHNIEFKEIESEVIRKIKSLGLEKYLNTPISNLSKGNKQKIQFICSSIHNPKLMILDEPFDGLDPISSSSLENEINLMKKNGVSVIISTHRMDQVEQLCEHLFFLNNGKLIVDSSVLEIKEFYRKNLYEIELNKEININILKGIVEIIENYDNRRYLIKLINNDISKVHLKLQQEDVFLIKIAEQLPSIREIFNEIVLKSS